MLSISRLFSSMRCQRRGVTLLQTVIVVALMAVLGSIAIPTYSRTRDAADRNRCDMQLKAIALALDAYRQAHHHLPSSLSVLQDESYIKDASQLRCPCDPRTNASYEDFYVLRGREDASDIPLLMCPFHENVGFGNQARIGLYTTQFATRPAQLEAVNSVTIESPGQEPRVGYAGMELHGGDHVRTAGSGTAKITFADGSQAVLKPNTDVTVLQSFIDGHQAAPLYTVLRQTSGIATYTVHHGSRFDVTTPTATAGARGTQFIIEVSQKEDKTVETTLTVTEGKVAFTGGAKTVVVPAGDTSIVTKLLKGLLGGLGGLL